MLAATTADFGVVELLAGKVCGAIMVQLSATARWILNVRLVANWGEGLLALG
jgi:hypothetical protein